MPDEFSEIGKADVVSRLAEPGVMIPRSVLGLALGLAQRAAEEINQRIVELEQQRDSHVRQGGLAQETIDRLMIERGHRTAHVRALSAAASRS